MADDHLELVENSANRPLAAAIEST